MVDIIVLMVFQFLPLTFLKVLRVVCGKILSFRAFVTITCTTVVDADEKHNFLLLLTNMNDGLKRRIRLKDFFDSKVPAGGFLPGDADIAG